MTLLPKLLLVAVAIGISTTAWAENLQQLLTEGQTAWVRGDIATAKRNFQLVYQADPRNPTAIGYLRQIAAYEKKNPGSVTTESLYKDIIIPRLEFREATLGAALDFMKKKVADASGGKKSVNFVLQLAPEQQNAPVSLNLTNIPFTEALRYIADSVGAKVDYQKFAVVIRSTSGGAAPASNAKSSPDAPAPQ